jgi:hypothetical protein
MFFKKAFILFFVSILFVACSNNRDNSKGKIDNRDIPNKITILFVTQPHCPSCDALDSTMKQKTPAEIIKKYFEVKKVNIGERLPKGLIPPNGTPTIYFLGYKDEALLEPMIGEKNETEIVSFLNEALYEFKNLYGVDLEKREKSDEINNSNINK